ncbi:MAG: hypothetical protein V9G19_00725 [Tetrasphaera sp.]
MTHRKTTMSILAAASAVTAATAVAAPATGSSAPAGGTMLLTINGNLHTIGGDGTGLRPITSGGGISDAAYSPDGRRIAYTKNVAGTPTIFVMPAAGGSSARLYPGENPSWSPDGTKLTFGRELANGNEHIYTAPARAGAAARRILAGNVDGGAGCYYLGYRDPKWSPTGNAIAVTKLCDDDHFVYSTVLARPTGGLIAGKSWGGYEASFNNAGTAIAAVDWDWAFSEQDVFRVNINATRATYLTTYQANVSYDDPVWSPNDAKIGARRTNDVDGAAIYDLVTFSSRDGSGQRTLLRGSATYRIVPRDWKAS